MKKLISVFAALALVGSLAAQKKKAPAKPAAPAAPAVAAPAAPAIAAPAVPAPAMGGQSGKGMGLFIEGRGSFTLGNGTSPAYGSGDQTSNPITYQLANTSGFGGGATIGYEIAEGLGLVASFDYRSISSREWSQTKASNKPSDGTALIPAALGGGTADIKFQSVTNTMVLGLGFRPTVSAFGGKIYGGAGFAYILPFDNVTTTNISNSSNALFNVTKTETTASKNAGIGAYGEFGYNFFFTENLYVGAGVRLLVATANNDGKKDVTKTTGTVNSAAVADSTTEYSTSAGGNNKSAYTSTGITDVSATVNVGFRF